MIRRREFIAGLGGATVWPLAARAQQQAMPVIGFLSLGPPPRANSDAAVTFRKGLAEVGYVEGQNVAIEYRGANGYSSQLPTLAAELVDRKVAVIMTDGFDSPVFAAKAATSTIPIVFIYGGDPVEQGIVASLAHPGGNVTGVTMVNSHLVGKRLSLMLDLVPQATTVAFLSNANAPYFAPQQKNQIRAAADALGREVVVLETRSNRDYEAAFKMAVQRQAGALIVGPFTFLNAKEIIALAERYNLPTIYPSSPYVKAGGLMSYSSDFIEGIRHAGIYVGRILKGEKPADLPVIVTTGFQLAINLKTAKALGLEIPPILLVQAHEVIE